MSNSRRIVVTGMGAVSCLGNDMDTITEHLRTGRNVFRLVEDDPEARCRVYTRPDTDPSEVDRKVRRMASEASLNAWLSAQSAVQDAGLDEELVRSERMACIVGDGGGAVNTTLEAHQSFVDGGLRKVSPFGVPKTMNSSCSALLSTYMGTRGPSYSVSSACATGAHNIGIAADLIRAGIVDRAIAGGSEGHSHFTHTQFDAMGALTRSGHEHPDTASCPYDANRDGFVPSSGAGLLLLEEREAALARGAKVYGELTGYAATSDGHDMVAPSGEGAVRCVRQAMQGLDGGADYINTHGTSTPAGDIPELEAMREVFGEGLPPLSSTKALTGHALGAAGSLEALFCLLMLDRDFITPCYNITQLDPLAQPFPLQRELKEDAGLRRVVSNSFGFGGTNAVLVFDRHQG